jgi:hypothetical protein
LVWTDEPCFQEASLKLPRPLGSWGMLAGCAELDADRDVDN